MNHTTTPPIGFWITAVDRLLRAEFATVFEDEGISRRDWRMLNRIDGTFGETPDQYGGAKLRRLIELGWIERDAEGWALTEPGRLAKQRLGTAVEEIRSRIATALTDEEYTVTTASLEKMARALGWEEGRELPRRPDRAGGRDRRGHGRHRRHDRRLGADCAHGHARHGHGHGHGEHGHGEHGHGPWKREHNGAQHLHIHIHH